MKKICIVVLLFAVNILLFSAEWINFDNSDNITPEDILMQSNDSFVEFEVTIPGMNSFDLDDFQRVFIYEHTKMDSVGYPELPIVSFLIAIPECGDIDLNIAVFDSTIIDSINIYPAPELIEVTAPEGYTYLEEQFAINNTLYNTDEYFPGHAGEFDERGAVRSQHCIRINLYPVQFNPVQQEIIAYSRLHINVTFSDVAGSINEDVGIFNEVCGHSMINYNSNGLNASINCGYSNTDTEEPQWVDTFSDCLDGKYISQNCDYLIVTHHDFWNDQYIQQLAEKRADYNGLNVVIVKMFDVQEQIIGNYDPDNKLKILIQNTYNWGSANHTFDNKLGYVNLFCDTQMQNLAQNPVPTHEEGSDSYFSELTIPPGATEPDKYPDIMIGRCSVDSPEQVVNVVTKILNYEPLEANPVNGWRNRTLTLLGTRNQNSLDHYYKYQIGLNYLNNIFSDFTNNIVVPLEYLSYYSIPNNYNLNDPYTFTTLEALFLQENIFVNYMGHGGTGCWWTYFNSGPDHVYYNDNPYNGLCNDFTTISHFPLITSFACLTGAFHNNDDCMAEEFLCSDSNSGAIAFIGSSVVSSTSTANITSPLFYENLVDNGLYEIGEALLATKIQDLMYAPDFNLIGDPAINYFIDEDNMCLPDLKILESFVTYDFDYPDYQNCNIEILILNNSPITIPDTDEFIVNIYYKESLNSPLNLLLSEPIYGLVSNTSHEINLTWNAGYENLGYKYIIVKVDDTLQITERSEDNNEITKRILITNNVENFPVYFGQSETKLYYEEIHDSDNISEIITDRNLINPVNPTDNWYFDDNIKNLSIGDLNADGEKEIYLYFYYDHSIRRVIVEDGIIDNNFEIPYLREALFSIDKNFLYCLEQNTSLEVLCKRYDYNGNFTLLYDFSQIGVYKAIPPVLCDVNNDGYKDVGILLENHIYVVDGLGGDILFSITGDASDIIIADLDKDGTWELILAVQDSESAKVIVYDVIDGSIIYESSSFDNELSRSVILSDTDDNNFPEIVFTTDQNLRIIDVPNMSVNLTVACETNLNYPVSGNVNSDLNNEIIFINKQIVNGTIKHIPTIIHPSSGSLENIHLPVNTFSICLGNFNTDSTQELIAQTSATFSLSSFDFLEGSNNVEWGQYRYDAQNSACYDTRIYDLPEETDIVWSNKIILHGQVELPSSSTLTISPGTIIKAKENSKLTVYGDLIVNGTENRLVKFIPIIQGASQDFWQGLEFLEGNGNIELNHVVIQNANLNSERDITINGGSFINTPLLQDNQSLWLTDVDFDNSPITAELYEITQLEIVSIHNCHIHNSPMNAGIEITGYPNIDISDNVIENCDSGIKIWDSGSGIINSISNNIIQNNTQNYGIFVYHSYIDILGYNVIENNRIGLFVSRDSNFNLVGSEDYPLQIIRMNNEQEVKFTYDSRPIQFYYNKIYDENHEYSYVKCELVPPLARQIIISSNNWGTSFNPNTDLCPLELFTYLPIWDPGMPRNSDFDSDEEMYLSAKQHEKDENYSAADQTYKQIISIYPESEYAKIAAKELLALKVKYDLNFSGLKLYFETEPNMHYDEEMINLSAFLINCCNIKLEEFQPAITWFEEIIQNPPSTVDSVFAVIDAGYTYLLMENSGRAQYVGKISELKPESRKQHEEKRDELMNMLFGNCEPDNEIPSIIKLVLYSNYPNPFNPSTTISFSLPKESKIELSVYNIKGQKVKTIVKDEFESGKHSVIWYGKDNNNKKCSSGIYFYQLKVNGKSKSVKKCLMLK